jgi:hypothetical protein
MRTHTPPATAAPDAYELALAIARHLLPSRWTAKRHRTSDGEVWEGHADLSRASDGAEISVVLGGYRKEGRVTFRAQWPRYHDGQTYSPRQQLSITCSVLRSPKALAGELQRRLLGEYDGAFREALATVHASDAAAGDARDAAARIARAIGATLPDECSYRQQRSGDSIELLGGPAAVYRLKVSPGYGGAPPSVRFEAQGLDEQVALRILASLAADEASQARSQK